MATPLRTAKAGLGRVRSRVSLELSLPTKFRVQAVRGRGPLRRCCLGRRRSPGEGRPARCWIGAGVWSAASSTKATTIKTAGQEAGADVVRECLAAVPVPPTLLPRMLTPEVAPPAPVASDR